MKQSMHSMVDNHHFITVLNKYHESLLVLFGEENQLAVAKNFRSPSFSMVIAKLAMPSTYVLYTFSLSSLCAAFFLWVV